MNPIIFLSLFVCRSDCEYFVQQIHLSEGWRGRWSTRIFGFDPNSVRTQPDSRLHNIWIDTR